jgi:RNA polymerase sigma factor (TIGR02999 family)
LPDPHADITTLLHAWNQGGPAAFDRVAPRVYGEMRKIARAYVQREPSGNAIQTTDLVNEACLKLMGQRHPAWSDRGHFYGVVAKIMRRLLTDLARERRASKRGEGWLRITLSDKNAPAAGPDFDVLALHEAMDELERLDPRLAQVVELRFYCGLSVEETAEVVEVCAATVKRDWACAKAWLLQRLNGNGRH